MSYYLWLSLIVVMKIMKSSFLTIGEIFHQKDIFVYLEKDEWITYTFSKEKRSSIYVSIDSNYMLNSEIQINDVLVKSPKDNTYIAESNTVENILEIKAIGPVRVSKIKIS